VLDCWSWTRPLYARVAEVSKHGHTPREDASNARMVDVKTCICAPPSGHQWPEGSEIGALALSQGLADVDHVLNAHYAQAFRNLRIT
jgi:hypothetical protein